ncbi:hypothetical protein [Desulfosporosinus sp. SB140]|uniref:hypothetical protein n=1 Tax=Desulfosporosinus paludis TaxID=3115649 RepID=UPI00388FA79E
MDSISVIKILSVTLVASLYAGFIIRLIRNDGQKVFSNALKICSKMIITPFIIPLILFRVKRNLDHNKHEIRRFINDTIDQQLKEKNLSEEYHTQIYEQVTQQISTPMFFINTSAKLVVNYLKEWDKNVDILINEKAKSQIPIRFEANELPLAINIFRIIVESISRNNLLYLRIIK